MKRIKALFKLTCISALFLWGTGINQLAAQDTITLEFCYQQVQKTYPLIRQAGLLDKSSDLRTKNLNKYYLPQFNVNGSATWQNEVTEVVIPLPAGLPQLSGPVIPKDQYKLTLDVNENIYDGNVKRQFQLNIIFHLSDVICNINS